MANFKGIVYLTDEQYTTLKDTGTIAVGGITLTYDENTLYVTPDTAQPSGVSQEDFNKLLNNTTIIMPNANESVLLGSNNAAALLATQSVIIGKNAKTVNKGVAIGYGAMTTVTDGGVAVGDYAETENGVAVGKEADSIGESIAIGNFAETSANNSIQLGEGTNTTDNTLQIFDDNIYNHNTHTLTVQNVELNGNNLQQTLNSKAGGYVNTWIINSDLQDGPTLATSTTSFQNKLLEIEFGVSTSYASYPHGKHYEKFRLIDTKAALFFLDYSGNVISTLSVYTSSDGLTLYGNCTKTSGFCTIYAVREIAE